MALFTASASAGDTYKGYELPPFEVVERKATYEVRDYAPHLVATVRMEGGVQRSASKGFRALAGYIFGGNATGEKIAMTVPVGQVPDGDGHRISFMMPARFAETDLPKPENPRIAFERTEAERLAVARFSGWAGEATLRRQAARLRDHLERDGHRVLAGPRYAYYDDPFTLPWNRRNEVAFVIAK